MSRCQKLDCPTRCGFCNVIQRRNSLKKKIKSKKIIEWVFFFLMSINYEIRTRIFFFIKNITNSISAHYSACIRLNYCNYIKHNCWYDWNSFIFVNSSLNYLGKRFDRPLFIIRWMLINIKTITPLSDCGGPIELEPLSRSCLWQN